MSDSVWPHRWQPTRLPHPWDSPGKHTGGGCHFLLQCMKVKSESEVAQSCPTLRNPMDCSLPGSYIHGIFQARLLEWGAIVQRKVKKKSPCGHVILLLILTVPRGEPLQPPRRKVLPEYAQKFPFLWLLIQRRQVGIFQSVLTRDSRGRKCSRKYQWYAKVRFPKDGFLFLNIFF